MSTVLQEDLYISRQKATESCTKLMDKPHRSPYRGITRREVEEAFGLGLPDGCVGVTINDKYYKVIG